MQFTASGQNRVQVVDRGIKAEADEDSSSVTFLQLHKVSYPGNQVHQSSLCYHHTLGTTGRARGINHIRSAVRRCQTLERTCRFHGFQGLFCYHHLCFAVLNHVTDAVFWIIHVNGHIGGTCLLYGHHCYHELFDTIHLDGDEIVGVHPLAYQPVSQGVRLFVKLTVSQLAGGVDNSSLVGMCLRLLLELVYPCERTIVVERSSR